MSDNILDTRYADLKRAHAKRPTKELNRIAGSLRDVIVSADHLELTLDDVFDGERNKELDGIAIRIDAAVARATVQVLAEIALRSSLAGENSHKTIRENWMKAITGAGRGAAAFDIDTVVGLAKDWERSGER